MCFSVTDSGTGISSEIKSHIFDSFFTTKKVGKGTGIGLGLARKIAKSHKGSLEFVETASNTQFVLKIPF